MHRPPAPSGGCAGTPVVYATHETGGGGGVPARTLSTYRATTLRAHSTSGAVKAACALATLYRRRVNLCWTENSTCGNAADACSVTARENVSV